MRTNATPFTTRNSDKRMEYSDPNRVAQTSKQHVSENQLQGQITGNNFSRDGILLSPTVIWGPLVRHLLMETKRREAISSSDTSAIQNHAATSDDVEKLIAILQRSENHMLAIRVILCSWHHYSSKQQVLL